MGKRKAEGKWRPFVDGNPAIDEYADEIGLVVYGRMMFGLILHRDMIGLILLNRAAGIWMDELADRCGFFDSMRPTAAAGYLLRLAVMLIVVSGLFWLM